MMEETEEGQTKFCQACEAEARYGGRSYAHVCGKSNEKDESTDI